jgi:hypothetical protein
MKGRPGSIAEAFFPQALEALREEAKRDNGVAKRLLEQITAVNESDLHPSLKDVLIDRMIREHRTIAGVGQLLLERIAAMDAQALEALREAKRGGELDKRLLQRLFLERIAAMDAQALEAFGEALREEAKKGIGAAQRGLEWIAAIEAGDLIAADKLTAINQMIGEYRTIAAAFEAIDQASFDPISLAEALAELREQLRLPGGPPPPTVGWQLSPAGFWKAWKAQAYLRRFFDFWRDDRLILGKHLMPAQALLVIEGEDQEPDAAVSFEFRDGRPEVTKVVVAAKPDGRGVRTADLRAFALDELSIDVVTRLGLRHFSRADPEDIRMADPERDYRHLGREVREARSTRRGALTQKELKEVARIYREHLQEFPSGKPTHAVERAFGYSARTAARRVQQARAAGLLPKTTPGKRKA